MNKTIDFQIFPQIWSKTTFNVGIDIPMLTDSISVDEYQKTVRESIKIWEDSLHRFSLTDSQHSHLANFSFTINDRLSYSDDIQVRWWSSHPDKNGLTVTLPTENVSPRSFIFISQQKLDLKNLAGRPTFFSGEVHNCEQIKSIAMHEFGHVLNIADCSDCRDLMSHGGPQTPNTNRKLSNFDLEIVSMTFRSGYAPSNQFVTIQKPYKEWKPF